MDKMEKPQKTQKMTEIIPGILVHSLKELQEKLNAVKWAKKVHIDIMDGKFVPNKTIQALTLKKALPKMDMQIHLMAKKPHTYINKFARIGAAEFIFHVEATKNPVDVLEKVRSAGMKAGIAFNPETAVDKHALIHADMALVMTVHPGFSGQRFLKTPIRKLAQIKKYNPIIRTGVDGGINHTTCRHARSADFMIATSAITTAANPQHAYNSIKRRCK